jgi:hypothetical protein
VRVAVECVLSSSATRSISSRKMCSRYCYCCCDVERDLQAVYTTITAAAAAATQCCTVQWKNDSTTRGGSVYTNQKVIRVHVHTSVCIQVTGSTQFIDDDSGS